jgi:hypothetical protein
VIDAKGSARPLCRYADIYPEYYLACRFLQSQDTNCANDHHSTPIDQRLSPAMGIKDLVIDLENGKSHKYTAWIDESNSFEKLMNTAIKDAETAIMRQAKVSPGS